MSNTLLTTIVLLCALLASVEVYGFLYGLQGDDIERPLAAALLPTVILPFLFLRRLHGAQRPRCCAAVFLAAFPTWHMAVVVARWLDLNAWPTVGLLVFAMATVTGIGLVLCPRTSGVDEATHPGPDGAEPAASKVPMQQDRL